MMAANPSVAVGGSGAEESDGFDALDRLRSASPPLFLSPSPDLSLLARAASEYLYFSLLPSCPKSPLDRLLAGDSFDAEQIWHQIDLQSAPLLSSLRKDVKRFEKMKPREMTELFGKRNARKEQKVEEQRVEAKIGGGKGVDVVSGMEEDEEKEDEGEEQEEDEEDQEEEEIEGEEEGNGVEDRFLKIKDLEEYMKKDEAREFGANVREGSEEDEEEEGDDDGDNEQENEFGDILGDADSDGEMDTAADARYEDFFGSRKKNSKKSSPTKNRRKNQRSPKELESLDLSEDIGIDYEHEESLDGSEDLETNDDDNNSDSQNKETLSTFEKQHKKLQAKIEQLEKESLEPRSWTMLGEVTAAQRPKNSALEVDLDYRHNRGHPPVTTEEDTAAVEDIILKRIREGRLDDVQKAPTLPSIAPKEVKELDENKSKKGLAEIYEEEYAQKTGLVSVPLSFSDEQKKEASLLFKKLCLKLDALSHFHFSPKPVIEDMSIQVNVPALAMEEIAPMAVSDAAMLAPEEIFSGKGDIKEDVELTQAERKRRRANKKRKFKAKTAKQASRKAHKGTVPFI